MRTAWKIGGTAAGALAAGIVAMGLFGGSGSGDPSVVGSSETLKVWKTPTCGCCAEWVEHMADAGFRVRTHDVSERELMEIKRDRGVPAHLASCHTATVDGYSLEGHVPAEDVQRLLSERPDVRGIAVPGMPLGSPGMDFGGRQDPYQVIAFDEEGGEEVFSRHP